MTLKIDDCGRTCVSFRSINDLRVLALAISLASFGSSQIFLLPHPKIDEASRFCTRSELIHMKIIESSFIERFSQIVYLIFFQNDDF